MLVDSQPIFDYLRACGHSMEGEHVVIGGWPFQFWPPNGPLLEEAIKSAITFEIEGMTARVFTAEHLSATALQTGRAKGKARLLQFFESVALNAARFENIVNRHGLAELWKRFKGQFLDDAR